jgi:hypothetical protein
MRLLVLWLVVSCSASAARAAIRDDAPVATVDDQADQRRWFAGNLDMDVADGPDAIALSITQIASAAARAGVDFVVLAALAFHLRGLASAISMHDTPTTHVSSGESLPSMSPHSSVLHASTVATCSAEQSARSAAHSL